MVAEPTGSGWARGLGVGKVTRQSRRICILFVSAATNQFESDFAERGIKDVVAKPFDLNDLLAQVRVLCPTDAGEQN